MLLDEKIEGCQMALQNFVDVDITENIVALTDEYMDEIYELGLVMSGYYRKRSLEMGIPFLVLIINNL